MTPTEIGLEHEFTVDHGGARVDFRKLIHELDLPGRAIDPGDRYAYRLDSGAVVTCDDAEAEVATVPVPIEPGWPSMLASWARAAAGSLVNAVPDATLTGWSTHLSVTADPDLVGRACGLFSRTFAPALMLLMEQTEGEGLLVRPRYGRIEFGGDYVTGDALTAAAAMAAGGALTCLDVAAKRRSKRALPPAVEVDVVAAVDRYGWFVDRRSFGFDLRKEGRRSTFRREYFGSIGGQRLLEVAWDVAREALAARSAEGDLAAAAAIVAGDLPLPLEGSPRRSPMSGGSNPPAHPLGQAMTADPTGKYEPVVATWDFVVFLVAGDPVRYWSVPRDELPSVLDAIRRGDAVALMTAVERDGTLRSHDAARRGGVFGELELGRGLAPPEPGRDGVFRLAS